jgi:hypothetical protein
VTRDLATLLDLHYASAPPLAPSESLPLYPEPPEADDETQPKAAMPAPNGSTRKVTPREAILHILERAVDPLSPADVSQKLVTFGHSVSKEQASSHLDFLTRSGKRVQYIHGKYRIGPQEFTA